MRLVILQIEDTVAKNRYGFMSYDFAFKNGFDLDDYKVVFDGETVMPSNMSDFEFLDRVVFRAFNRVSQDDVVRLENLGFTGHSLSTSDLVQLDNTLYYCDSISWKRLEKVVYKN